ncbi:ATPase [bacterium]|nr:MAG: ATPase [bacterium]
MVRENRSELLRKLPDSSLILAVDGGASKTDVALIDAGGNIVGAARRAGSTNFGLGSNGSLEALEKAVAVASRNGGLDASRKPIAGIGVYCLAGADIPADYRRIAAELEGRGWTRKTLVRNDTLAVLRAGTDRGWGVAVVFGTGMNCAGIGPGGRSVRFPAFGELSGDRAHGGGWLGRAALGSAIRARDGRGPRTMLERLVPEHFSMSRPTTVMEAVYVGRLDAGRLSELSPVVFSAAAQGDQVSQRLIDEMADEVVATAGAAIRRLHVASRDVHVVLGGGVFRSRDKRLLTRVRTGIEAIAPKADLRLLEAPPVLGAALIGLDEVGAGPLARERLRVVLTHKRLLAKG